MLFKNLNNFTLEERVLYLQDKTKEITEWITAHGGESEDIHTMIQEQIQQIIADKDLDHSQITARLNSIEDELNTIESNFNSQIAGLRTETQTYTNNAIAQKAQSKLYMHYVTLTFIAPDGVYTNQLTLRVIDTQSEAYTDLMELESKNFLHSFSAPDSELPGIAFDAMTYTDLYFHSISYGNSTSYKSYKVAIQSFTDEVIEYGVE